MLRKIRLVAALLFFTMITLLFLDFTGTVHSWFGWMAKIQFLPAVLALNVGVMIALVLLTLLLGRVYCSVVCPLGVFQDIISWVSGRVKKNRFRYSPALSWLRYGVLAVFIVALVAGVVSLTALIAPYSAYGRIISNLLTPLYQWGNNVLALWAERVDSYAFYSWMSSTTTNLINLLTAYLWVIVVMEGYRLQKVQRAMAPLVSYGRMGLTNYIAQSVIGVFIFSGFGLDWSHLGVFLSVLVCLAYTGVQIVFSHYWLKKFRYGPMEWLWRTGTYMKWQPLAR